ncbi:hypothetical protein OROHE_008467 [Orobanche hederae]
MSMSAREIRCLPKTPSCFEFLSFRGLLRHQKCARHQMGHPSLSVYFSPYPPTNLRVRTNPLMFHPNDPVVQNQETPSESKHMTAHTGKSNEPEAASESEHITVHTEKSNEPKSGKSSGLPQMDLSSLDVDFSRYLAGNQLICPNPLVVQNQQAPSESEQMTANSEEINEPEWCSISGSVSGEAQKMGADVAHVLNKDEDRDLAQKTVLDTTSTLNEDDDSGADLEDDDSGADVEDDDCGADVEDNFWVLSEKEYLAQFKRTMTIFKDRLHEDEKDVKVFNKNFKKYVQHPLALRKLSCKLEWGEGNEGQITLDLRTKEGTSSFGSGRWATYALHIGLSTRDAEKIISGKYNLHFWGFRKEEEKVCAEFKSYFEKEAAAQKISCRLIRVEVRRPSWCYVRS